MPYYRLTFSVIHIRVRVKVKVKVKVRGRGRVGGRLMLRLRVSEARRT